MFKPILTCLALAAILALPAAAVEVKGGVRYHTGSSYAEGTISSIGDDGRITVRGAASPYARDYVTYHHGYYAAPETGRVTYRDGYRDKFRYSWSDDNLTDYTFTVPEHKTYTVYDEPSYGTEFSTWKYNTTPRTYGYSDLKAGDRVVVSYGDGFRAQGVYRVSTRK